MTRTPRAVTARILLAAALVVAAPVALAGCSLIGNGVGGVVQGVVEGATGTDVDLSGGMPADFPTEVPLVGGDVATGGSLGSDDGKVWVVGIKVSGPEAYDEASAKLAEAGFASGFEASDGDSRTGSFTKDDLTVLVAVADPGDGFVATYTVTKSGS
ncbi:MAG: hypothetical protein J0G30_07415 [Actinomycetales bacterium]|nr:hypothetical protein [Actinomycetales bacterium]